MARVLVGSVEDASVSMEFESTRESLQLLSKKENEDRVYGHITLALNGKQAVVSCVVDPTGLKIRSADMEQFLVTDAINIEEEPTRANGTAVDVEQAAPSEEEDQRIWHFLLEAAAREQDPSIAAKAEKLVNDPAWAEYIKAELDTVAE